MIIGGIFTAIGFVFIAAKFSPNVLQRMLGYDWVIDLLMTLGIMLLFGATGTISGVMTGIFTGISISIILWLAKNTGVYQKLVKVDGNYEWVKFNGKWTLAYIAQKAHQSLNSFSSLAEEVKNGWNSYDNVYPINGNINESN